MPLNAVSSFDELKQYVGFSDADTVRLRALAAVLEPFLPALADRFYDELARHPDAPRVLTGGAAQVAWLKLTLQRWVRGLFSGVYKQAYARERAKIGFRHVQVGLPQRYVIAAMNIVERFIGDVVDRELADPVDRNEAHHSLSRILNLDLNLICDAYVEGSLEELRQLNERLAETNRALEQADRIKSDSLAIVSHELRTPLTEIVGFSKLLADDAVPQPEMRREFIRDIHSSALPLLSLVDDLLDLARIESGHLEVRPARVDLINEIRQAMTAVELEADRKHLRLESEIATDLPTVRGDGPRIRQVLTNLLGNAIKFTDRGSVRVRAGVAPDRTHAFVSVEDTGIGIAPESIPRLFEKFRQLDTSTRRRGGVGLGLAICKTLVEHMGGSIVLQSEGVGCGTRATVWFGIATADTTHVPRVALVADAEAATRQEVAESVALAGYHVRHAGTEDGFRGIAASTRIDLIAIDATSEASRSMLTRWVSAIANLQRGRHSPQVVVFLDRELSTSSRAQLDWLRPRPTIVKTPVDRQQVAEVLGGLWRAANDRDTATPCADGAADRTQSGA